MMQFSMSSKKLMANCLVCLSFIWLGMIIGVSFVATPAKFLTPTLGLPIAVDVGRHVFGVFNKVEVFCGIASFILVLIIRPPKTTNIAFAVIWTILVLQTFWLFPFLSERVEYLLQDTTLPKSIMHTLYAVMEVAKMVTLGFIGYRYISIVNSKL